ncbi:uncharacterized protein LOC114726662 [Neltuma alba]|uniref:uncharacterized protein LOC114726662 n=1 Tax=Neltuma alba TaxID=207710 RepID=UPI0010A3960B|nr:uncharacterized protein LOC114726662 [Prosopis alba]
MEQESNKKTLFSWAMKGRWGEVIDMYRQDARLHNARITRSGHTALHIAVSDGKEDVVKQMLHVMSQKQPRKEGLIKALRTPNNRNNTALHLAASMGNSRMCYIIASEDPALVDDRNVDGETPLFLAALHGRKQAFLCLHHIRNGPTTTPLRANINTVPFYANCRRNNGDTILHAAIHGNYFDLAFQIIHLYEDLANWVNEEGCSPLHLLASKPCAFKSGSHLGRMETIIYHCIYVEKLKLENQEHHKFPVLSNIGKPVERDAEDPGAGGPREDGGQTNPLFPANYQTCCDLIKFFFLVIVTIFVKGSKEWKRIYEKKQTHKWSVQIVKQLLHSTSQHEYEADGGDPKGEGYNNTTSPQQDAPSDASAVKPSSTNDKEDKQRPKGTTAETPILVAAKNGVVEMIEEIVEVFPVAIYDLNEDKKNIVLLAAEHSQPKVYQFLREKNIYRESLFHQVDKDGNSALHLAATLRDDEHWLIPGDALQMQWEQKWYKFVKENTPSDFIGRYNRKNETPDVVFTKTHRNLQKRAAKWMNKTSESCSVVAALVATVAFTTNATVPGGVVQETGQPTLEGESQFQLFAISSLVALGCSVTALVMFLSILTSRFQERDFEKDLPGKLLVGLTSLFVSIAFMLVSFCAGHFFVLKDTLRYLALPIYVVTCLPVTLFVLAQFPLYFDLLRATFKHVPKSSGRPMLLDVNGDPQQTLANKVDHIITLLSHGAGKQQEGNEKGTGQGHPDVQAS